VDDQPGTFRIRGLLAEKLAAYADRLRYEDLDAATIERVKSHVIDTLGCGTDFCARSQPLPKTNRLSEQKNQ
jgi:2-methylcitrate dehydratase PrpD